MKIKYQKINLRPQATLMIEVVNKILHEYAAGGFTLTLRQLYYQCVARDLFPEDRKWSYNERKHKWERDPLGTINAEPNYKWLGSLVGDGRMAGLIDWDSIMDRNRETVILSHWQNPGQILKSAALSFRIDKWEDQPCHIEVMVEKDALSGILQPICMAYDVPFTANKGYSSLSTLHETAGRIGRMLNFGKQVHILYLGDHDPSGIDMTRDVRDRLGIFTEYDDQLSVHRLALNMDQVKELNPPENPAKATDSRYGDYYDKFGDKSWELDAVEPKDLAAIVSSHIVNRRDDDLWDEAVKREDAMKKRLAALAKEWEK